MENLLLCGMITSEWLLKTYEEREWIGFIWLRIWGNNEVL